MPDDKAMLVRWFEEVWNQGRLETIEEMLAADCIIHDGETATKGPDGFKTFYHRLRTVFSEIRVTPHDGVAEGDMACLRWSVTMRHAGDGLGMPATGKLIRATGISMVRFKDGRFAECWQNWDMLGAMEQIKAAERAAVYMGFQGAPPAGQ